MIPKSSAKLRLKGLGLRSMGSGSAERKGRQCQVQVLQNTPRLLSDRLSRRCA